MEGMADVKNILPITKQEYINLSFKHLSHIPESVYESALSLRKFVFAGNPITMIPVEVDQLSSLTFLNIGSCEVTTCCCTFTSMPNLTYLNMGENKLHALPSSLSLLTNLTELDVSGNLLEHIENLPCCLTVLKLSRCRLTAVPSCIAYLTMLKELYLFDNQISGPIPFFIYALKSLEVLDLSKNKIVSLLDDSHFQLLPSERSLLFGNLGRLRSVALNDNLLEMIPSNTVSNWTSLTVLSLQYNQIASIPDDLLQLVNLNMLDLSVNKISIIPENIAAVPNLVSLDLSYNDMSVLPQSLTTLTTMKMLSVVGNNFEELPAVGRILLMSGVRVRYNEQSVLPNEILPGLYLGGVTAARDKYNLRRLGIQYILTVAEIDPIYPDEFNYLVLKVDDHDEQDLSMYFREAKEFIEEGIKSGGVLVHCAAGISRSATMVIMYIMTLQKIGMQQAFDFVIARRPVICPNSGFRQQLQEYEKVLLEGKTPRKRSNSHSGDEDKCRLM